jgi:hypothetical protein
MKAKQCFSQPTEVVLASGLEHPPNLYYELRVKKNVLFPCFKGFLIPSGNLFRTEHFLLSLSQVPNHTPGFSAGFPYVYSHFFLVFLGNIAHLFYVLLSEL